MLYCVSGLEWQLTNEQSARKEEVDLHYSVWMVSHALCLKQKPLPQ